MRERPAQVDFIQPDAGGLGAPWRGREEIDRMRAAFFVHPKEERGIGERIPVH